MLCLVPTSGEVKDLTRGSLHETQFFITTVHNSGFLPKVMREVCAQKSCIKVLLLKKYQRSPVLCVRAILMALKLTV